MTDGIPNQPLYFYQKDIIGSGLSHNIFMVRYSHALPSKKIEKLALPTHIQHFFCICSYDGFLK